MPGADREPHSAPVGERPAPGGGARPGTPLPARPGGVPPLAVGPVLAVAGVPLVVLLALAGRYGPHRDELYFVAAGRRLAWGYPDQPPLTPLLARVADVLAPGSLVALHAVAALLAAGVVLVAALTARELGGGRAAQVITAVTVATGATPLVLGHMLSTATTDMLLQALLVGLVVRVLRRDAPRLWPLVGVVAGVGLLNKHLVALLLAALVLGVATTRGTRHHLRSPWAWAGAAVALALWAPNLAWQAAHGWPQRALAADIQEEFGTAGERGLFVALLLVLLSPAATVLVGWGATRPWRDPGLVRARPVVVAAAALVVLYATTGGKAYYLVGVVPALVALGAVGLEARWPARRVRRAGVVLAAVAAVAWPAALPLLPAGVYGTSVLHDVVEEGGQMIGWPEVVATVREVVDDSGAVLVVTANYGEAGALEWYGIDVPVHSGHNGYAAWGPPPDAPAGPVVLVGFREVPAWARGCRTVATLDNAAGVDNEERGRPVAVCSGPAGTWAEVWPRVRRLAA
ncbi:glycosyltransferase family 39 protein [Cellulomonas endophytica]|uniref:glycosyltransferase family 39 protein n=1 Tax=Cellulomonas endophytica TaxID=2494735 RepID=UPI001011B364|nr:glycosyltransferase family 39 protein [Cellulomonas endophytica]